MNILTEVAVMLLDMFCRKSHGFSTFVGDGGDDGDGGSMCEEAAGNVVVTGMTGIEHQLEGRLCSTSSSV